MARVVVKERSESMEHVLVLWVVMVRVQLSLLAVWHRVELFDVPQEILLIEAFNVCQLHEAKSCHLLEYTLNYIYIWCFHIDGPEVEHVIDVWDVFRCSSCRNAFLLFSLRNRFYHFNYYGRKWSCSSKLSLKQKILVMVNFTLIKLALS